MGMFLSTFHVKIKGVEDSKSVIDILKKTVKKRGYSLSNEEEADLSFFLFASTESSWLTVTSEIYEEDENVFNNDCKIISKELNTLCLQTSVFDSDIAKIALINENRGLSDTVVIGDPNYVKEMLGVDYSKFNGEIHNWLPLLSKDSESAELFDVFNGEYIFVEESIEKMAKLIGFNRNALVDYRSAKEETLENVTVSTSYFKRKQSPLIENGPSILKWYTLNTFISDRIGCITFYNTGGVSMGLQIVMLGDFMDSKEVIVNEVELIKLTKDDNPWNEKFIVRSKAETIETNDGRRGYSFMFSDFMIPKGISTFNYENKRPKNHFDMIVRFTVFCSQPDKEYVFSFFAIPLENKVEGQFGANLSLFGSEELFEIDFKRKREKLFSGPNANK